MDDLPDFSDKSDRGLLTSASIDLDEALVHHGEDREARATRALAKLVAWKDRQDGDGDG